MTCNGVSGEDSRRSDLEMHSGRLIELPPEDVLVAEPRVNQHTPRLKRNNDGLGDGDDLLDDQNAGAYDRCSPVPEVGMLPSNALVLLICERREKSDFKSGADSLRRRK